MTPQELLGQLIEQGAVVWVSGGKALHKAAHVELVGDGLYWANMFPDSQHSTHYIRGPVTVHLNRYLQIHKRGKLVAQVAAVADTPEVDRGAYDDMRASWQAYLGVPAHRQYFEQFVEQTRKEMTDTP